MGAIDTSAGRIGVATSGGDNATPILFLHGVGSDKSVWRPQLDHFGRRRRAVAVDYPGYGESDFRARATRDDYAAAVLAVMDSLGIGRAHVCGLSLGGVIAIAMHSAAPGRCASLVLADTFAFHPEGEAIYRRSIEASQAGMRSMAEKRVAVLLAPDTSDEVRREVVETMGSIDPAAFRIGAEAVWLADQRGRAAAIDVPALVLVGDLDEVTPPSLSEELAALVRGARLEVIAGASHLANLDRPAEFNLAVERFITEIDAKA